MREERMARARKVHFAISRPYASCGTLLFIDWDRLYTDVRGDVTCLRCKAVMRSHERKNQEVLEVGV